MEYKFKVNNKSYKIRKNSITYWLCTITTVVIIAAIIIFIAAIPSIAEWLIESNIL